MVTRKTLRLLRHQLFQQRANRLNHLDIFTLVVTANIVGFTNAAGGGDKIERAGVVIDEQPVADLLTVAVYRQRLTRQGVENSQRDQFFREVIRAVVV